MKHVKSKKGSELLGQILLWALLISALLVFLTVQVIQKRRWN